MPHDIYGNPLPQLQTKTRARQARSLRTTRSGTPKCDIRSVSFSANLLPRAEPMSPGHRRSSPFRSAIRSPSPERIIRFAIDSELDPPACTEEAICKQLHALRAQIVQFSWLFVLPNEHKTNPLDTLLGSAANRETVAFSSCLLLGGPDGKESWAKFFQDASSIQALVVGIISRVLKQHVFDQPYFGATQDETERLSEFERDCADLHGFARQRRMKTLLEDIANDGDEAASNAARQAQADRLLAQTFKLLSPLFELSSKPTVTGQKAIKLLPGLKTICSTAISCAHDMRRSDVAYEWTEAVKELEFNPKHEECFNVGEMLETSPYARNAEGHAALKPDQEHRRQSIVVGIVSPGLVSYRLDESLTEDVEMSGTGQPMNIDRHSRSELRPAHSSAKGFHRRVIMKNVVLLRWGEQSLKARLLGRPQDYDKALKQGGEQKEIVGLWDLFVERRSGKT